MQWLSPISKRVRLAQPTPVSNEFMAIFDFIVVLLAEFAAIFYFILIFG